VLGVQKLRKMKMIDIVWDMETSDPDDFLTLLLLCGHPKVNLKAVTVTPGTVDQVRLVCWTLSQFGLNHIPVGSFNFSSDKKCVSGWHYSAYNLDNSNLPLVSRISSGHGGNILFDNCNENTTVITGAPLKNFRLAMERGFKVGRWVAQGGFAGEGVIPAEDQLEKFKGWKTCPTYNLNGDPKTALAMLEYGGIGERFFVSKHICHGVYYNRELHERVAEFKDKSLSLNLIYQGMDKYLQKKPKGKKFHDPLAACCAINPTIGTWAEVELYRKKGKWGSKFSDSPNANIIVKYDHEAFVETLIEVE
jgi:pyrimidine-specific ribonucleoside hydrolase